MTRFTASNQANPGGRPRKRTFGALIKSLYDEDPERALALVEALDEIAAGSKGRRAVQVIDSLDDIAKALPKTARAQARPLLDELRRMAGVLEDPRTRLAAISEIFDRTDGKPAQSLSVTGRITELRRIQVEELPPDMRERIRSVEGRADAVRIGIGPPAENGGAPRTE